MNLRYELEGVGMRYNGVAVLRGVSLVFSRPELVTLIGPNGAGKSTLLNIMAGLKRGFEGRCLLNGRPVLDWRRREFARVAAFVPQTLRFDFPFTAEQVVLMGRTPYAGGFFDSAADWQAVRQGVLWGGVAFLITPLVELLSMGVLRLVLGAPAFTRLMDWEKQTVALDSWLETLQPGITMLGFILVVAVAAPIGEEMFFRGFVFNLLRHRTSFTSAVWLSAALFAVLHASVKNFLPILVIGVLLARLYARTGSLWSSVVMHGTFNFLSAMAAIILGG